ncbi:hypothetical protein DZK27_15625 [Rhodobacteraceae bacterium 63075]|nr:hypothetical protein DZK27_15625 [Rhodobacteraceae bacterium 63075]
MRGSSEVIRRIGFIRLRRSCDPVDYDRLRVAFELTNYVSVSACKLRLPEVGFAAKSARFRSSCEINGFESVLASEGLGFLECFIGHSSDRQLAVEFPPVIGQLVQTVRSCAVQRGFDCRLLDFSPSTRIGNT